MIYSSDIESDLNTKYKAECCNKIVNRILKDTQNLRLVVSARSLDASLIFACLKSTVAGQYIFLFKTDKESRRRGCLDNSEIEKACSNVSSVPKSRAGQISEK